MPGNKVDMSKLPNQGLKNLAKERPDVVKRMVLNMVVWSRLNAAHTVKPRLIHHIPQLR